jgi:hypothetical protein
MAVLLLWSASLQREIAWMALRQFSTMWIVAMTGVFVAGVISLQDFGVHRSTWVVLPVYIGCALVFPLVAMADALTNDTLLDDAPELLLRTWHADDPYQFEVGEAYLDLLDPRGSWARRRIRFESIARTASAKDAAYGVARQAFLEANVAAGRVFGARPNARSPLLARARALFR